MSNLKHLSLDELKHARVGCANAIDHMKTKAHRANEVVKQQQTRLEWIDHYILQKSPRRVTMEYLEMLVGRKLIIVPEGEEDEA